MIASGSGNSPNAGAITGRCSQSSGDRGGMMSGWTTRWFGGCVLLGPAVAFLVACKQSEAFLLFMVGMLAVIFVAGIPIADLPNTTPKAAVTRSTDWSYLGAAAHVSGAADTNWRSDVELHNASNEGATVTVELLAHGAANPDPESAEFFLGPRRSLRLSDVLASSFGDADKAALRISTTGGAILATDRTYNLLAQGNALGLPAGATFGQYIPLRDQSEAVTDLDEGRLIGLTHDDSARTNLVLVNTSSFEVRVKAELFLADGTNLGSFNTSLHAFEYRQITRVFERATSDPVADGYLVLTSLTEGGRFLAQASVVDAITGDPVFVPAARMAAPVGQAPPDLWIVAAAHVAGAAGSNWRTDLEVHNPNDEPVSYTVELLELNTNNSSPRNETRSLAPGASVRHVDALIDLFGFEGAAALRIVPDGGPMVAVSRTYNLLQAGNPYGLPDGATFGQFIPAVDASAAITPDSEGRMVHLAHDAGGLQGFRTNLILVNGTGDRTTVQVELFGADATPLGVFEQNLRAFEYRQINNVFARVTDDSVEDGYAVVQLTGDEGAVFALASVVDNLTGDPVGMMATPVRSAAADGMVSGARVLMDAMGGVGLEEPASIEAVIGWLQDEGVDGLAGILIEELPPGTATWSGGLVTVDYGDGTEVEGITLAGRIELDLSGLTIDASGVRGRMVESFDGYTVNGRAVEFDEISAVLDLEVRPDGTVVGTISLSDGPVGKATGAILAGQIGIDTGICLSYPVSGEVTFTSPYGEVVTISFGPDCDGSFSTKVEPAWDWDYRFQSPQNAWAHTHIESVENARVISDVADYWIPSTGGTEFHGRNNPGDTPPGIITYHFSYANPVLAARIRTDTATFHFETSSGHNYLLASKDGVSWEVINEVTPPDNVGDPPRNGYYDGLLPASVLGGGDLWIRVELYAYGTGAVGGFTNTAQHARFWESGARDTFILEVACANHDCGGS